MDLSSFGRGRGSLMAKMLNSGREANSTQSKSRQFIEETGSQRSPSQNSNPVVEGSFDDAVVDNWEDLELEELDEVKTAKEETAEHHAMNCLPTGVKQDIQIPVKPKVTPTTNLPTKSIELNEEAKAEQEWKMYQCQRKINKIVKDVNNENLDVVIEELSSLMEDCPISSRYANCSEVHQLLNVLVQKSIQAEEFIVFAPCLIKMVAEQEFVQFKQYFPELLEKSRKENVTLCASDEVLPKPGSNFCKLLGSLITIPRQTGSNLFDVVTPILDDFVERWSYADEELFDVNEYKDNFAAVHAAAMKELLLQITKKVLPCDEEVLKRLERCIWYTRETALNVKLPSGQITAIVAYIRKLVLSKDVHVKFREVRSMYLDLLVDVQVSHNARGSSAVYSEVEVEAETEGEIQTEPESVVEDEEYGDDYVEVEEQEQEQEKNEVDNTEKKEIVEVDNNDDTYDVVKKLLRDLEMDDLFTTFLLNNINDNVLNSPTLKSDLQAIGIPKFKSFNICLQLEKNDSAGEEDQKQILQTNAINTITESEQLPNDVKVESGIEKRQLRNSASSRMAINFNTSKDSSLKSPTQQKCLPTKQITTEVTSSETVSSEENQEKINILSPECEKDDVYKPPTLKQDSKTFEDMEDDDEIEDDVGDDDDEEDDIIIESSDEDESSNFNTTVVENLNETVVEKPTTFTVYTSSVLGSMPKGRGRGMVKLPKTNHRGKSDRGRGEKTNRSFDRGVNNRNNSNHYAKDNRRGFPPRTRSEFNNEKINGQNFHGNSSYNKHNNNPTQQRKISPKYYPKKNVVEEKPPTPPLPIGGFGLRKPKTCLRCSASDHTEESCPVINPFF